MTPTELSKLGPTQLLQVKRSLQKFFYTNGTNVALYSSLGKEPATEFKARVKQALHKQIDNSVTIENVSKLAKADQGVLIALAASWLIFSDAFNGGRAAILAFLLWAGNQGGQAALDKMVPPPHRFMLKDAGIKANVADRVSFLTEALDKTTMKWIATNLSNALESGMTTPEAVKYVRAESLKMINNRSEIISETELLTAMSLVESETFKRNGLSEHKWITSIDERVCPQCNANQSEGYIPIGNTFKSGAAAPPQHVGCRCYLLPKLPETINQKIWTGG